MRIISDRPVVYSNLDGRSQPSDVKAFQDWAISKGYKDKAGRDLVSDGKWGTKTAYVYNAYGKEFEGKASMPEPTEEMKKHNLKKYNKVWDASKKTWTSAKDSGVIDSLLQSVGLKDAPKTTTDPSSTDPDKKGMKKGVKIAIAVIGSVALIALAVIGIRAATKKK